MKTGGQLVVAALQAAGVRRVFCVPGESYLPALDALRDSNIRVVVCRNEGGAAMMAEADAKLSGRIGAAFVTRAPGAANAMAGVYVARHDSTPMILMVGQSPRGFRGRGGFQEMDTAKFFCGAAKWAADADDPARIPEMFSRAFHCALSGRMGPVVLGLPEDVLRAGANVAPPPPPLPIESAPPPEKIAAVRKLLLAARRPLAIVGGSGWTARGTADFQSFAERFRLPVACSFRRQGLFDHAHPNYAGEMGIGCNPKLKKRAAADFLLLAGGRFAEVPSQGYALAESPNPRRVVVHAHSDAGELGRVFRPTVGICAAPDALARALCGMTRPRRVPWEGAAEKARADYLAWSESPPVGNSRGARMEAEMISALRRILPEDATITNGAGNYAAALHRRWRYRGLETQLAPTSGTMGYGLPAAIAAKLARPKRTTVCLAGDGCFQMTMQEFATAVQERAAIAVVVVDNEAHGTIRSHQRRMYPGREFAVALRNPDFAAFARACGGFGETVSAPGKFAPAMRRALDSGVPALVHVRTAQ